MAGIVKSVQQVAVTIAAGQTSGTANITAVTMASASEHYSGHLVNQTTYNSATDLAGVALTSSTQVTATRNTSDASNALTVYVTVIDWKPSAITSIQRGTITLTGASSNTASLTFTLANSAVQFNGLTTTYTGNNPNNYYGTLDLTSGTITASRGGTTNNMTVYYCLVEFASGVLNSNTQQGVCSGTAATVNTTISSVTLAQTMLFYGGWKYTAGSSTADSQQRHIQLTTTTNVAGVQTGSSGGTASASFCVVEFKAADITSVNRGIITIATSGTTAAATITAVNTSLTIANHLGCDPAGASTNNGSVKRLTTVLTNTTTVTNTRQNSASFTDPGSWEAIEFVVAPATANGNMFLVF